MTIQDKIKFKLAEHGIGLEFDSMVVGGSVTLYRYEPSIGLKMSRIEAFVKDIEQVVETSGIRILAPIKDSGLVGFEIPNKQRTFPESSPRNTGFELAIGAKIMGDTKYYDIRTAPHLLVSGSSGSGKSVFLNSLIKQLMQIDNVDIHLFDPKQVEMSQFEGGNNVVDYQYNHDSIQSSLMNLVEVMNNRYSELRKSKTRNIEELGGGMKYKFVVIDEFADLMAGENTLNAIQLLAQKGRACGIHIILATQRASTKIISGDIKVNFPTRAVFKMAKAVDSRVMLDEGGAEKLLGKGDMLFLTSEGIERLQGFNL
jgi:S-DNA-T family DNA segregation ATPase FtsK/SpoIIIE